MFFLQLVLKKILESLKNHPVVTRVILFLFVASSIFLIVYSGLASFGVVGGNQFIDSYWLFNIALSQTVGANNTMFWIISMIVIGSGLLIIQLPNERDEDSIKSSRNLRIAVIAISLAIAGIVVASIIISRLRFSIPVGGDVLAYTSYVRMTQTYGASWAFLMTDRPLFYVFLYLFGAFVEVTSAVYWAAITGFVSSLFLLSTYFVIAKSHWSRWKLFGLVAVAVTSVSPIFMRMNLDLLSSEFGIIFLLLMFGIYFNCRSFKSISGLIFVALSICLLLSYWWFFIIGGIGLFLLTLAQKRDLKLLVRLMIPGLIVFVVMILFSAFFPPPSYWGIGSAITGLFRNQALPSWMPTVPDLPAKVYGPDSEAISLLLGSYDAVFMALTLVGLSLMNKIRPRSLAKFAIILALCGLGLMFFTLFSVHSATLVPLGIIVVGSIISVTGKRPVYVSLVILFLLILPLQSALNYQLTYATPLEPPSESGLAQLSWVSDNIGFGNKSYIMLVRNHYDFLWVLSFGIQNVYYGSLASALTGTFDVINIEQLETGDTMTIAGINDYIGSVQRLWTYGIRLPLDTSQYHLIITKDMYKPDPLEMQYLAEIGPSVYEVKHSNATELTLFARSWLSWKKTGDISNLLGETLQTFFTLNNSALWETPNNRSSVSIESEKGRVDVSIQTGARAPTQYVLYHLTGGLNLSSSPLLLALDINVTKPVQLAIVLQNNTLFQNYFTLDMGMIYSQSHLEIILSPLSMSSKGNPLWDDISYLSINVYSDTESFASITLFSLSSLQLSRG